MAADFSRGSLARGRRKQFHHLGANDAVIIKGLMVLRGVEGRRGPISRRVHGTGWDHRRLRFQLLPGECELGFINEFLRNELFLRSTPGQAVAGGNRVKTGVGGKPIDGQSQPGWIVRIKIGDRPHHHRVDPQNLRQPAEFADGVSRNSVVDHRRLGHRHRHHFKPLYLL